MGRDSRRSNELTIIRSDVHHRARSLPHRLPLWNHRRLEERIRRSHLSKLRLCASSYHLISSSDRRPATGQVCLSQIEWISPCQGCGESSEGQRRWRQHLVLKGQVYLCRCSHLGTRRQSRQLGRSVLRELPRPQRSLRTSSQQEGIEGLSGIW